MAIAHRSAHIWMVAHLDQAGFGGPDDGLEP
jgi:hypothetical protein